MRISRKPRIEAVLFIALYAAGPALAAPRQSHDFIVLGALTALVRRPTDATRHVGIARAYFRRGLLGDFFRFSAHTRRAGECQYPACCPTFGDTGEPDACRRCVIYCW